MRSESRRSRGRACAGARASQSRGGVAAVFVALGTVGAAGAWAASAVAGEPLPARADHVFSPGRNAASDDTGEALVLNPANLATMPSWEARGTFVRCPDDAKALGCGYAFELATPLPWNFATGLRFDYVQPSWGGFNEGVDFPYRGNEYSWLTWGLGLALSERVAFGMSVQRSYSQSAYLNDLVGLTAGVTWRPSSVIAFAAVAHDFNGPAIQALPPDGLPILDRSYVLAMALRPTGHRAFEIGAELKYLEGSQQWLPKVTSAIDVPGVGRLRGDVEMAHLPNDTRRGVLGTAGLEIDFDHVSAGGGALFGNGLGTTTSVGEYATLALSGWREPGVPRAQRAVFIRVEQTPGTRGHIALMKQLWKIAGDKEIAAVTLVLRAEPSSSYAHAEELADALRVLRAHGKKTLCSLEAGGTQSIYVCANADKTVINPAGALRYSGHMASYMYFAGLLKKLGVRAEFARIGAHKSAPEQLTNEQGSDAARADHEDLLRNVEAVFVKNLAQGRKMSEARVREIAKSGVYLASDARETNLVDGYAFDDELERVTQDLVGAKVHYEKYEEDTNAPEAFSAKPKVGLLIVDGDIVDGRSSVIPIVDMHLVGSYTIVDAIKQLKEDANVKSVVLRIESPGGSSIASEVMWRELVKLSEKKPLIVSMGATAASGGYYIASAGKVVFALPLTITGSIGIFFGKADVVELMKKLGVTIETYKTAPHVDAESLYRPYTQEEKDGLQKKIQVLYDIFVDRVASGRHMTKEEVDAVGQGRVWAGQQAVQNHLVDRMGGLRHALEVAREMGGLPSDSAILELPKVETSLFDRVLKLAGFDSAKTVPVAGLPLQMRDLLYGLAPFVVYSGDTPLARLDWAPFDSGESGAP